MIQYFSLTTKQQQLTYKPKTKRTGFVGPQLCEEQQPLFIQVGAEEQQPPDEAHFGSSICAVRELWPTILCTASKSPAAMRHPSWDYPMYSFKEPGRVPELGAEPAV